MKEKDKTKEHLVHELSELRSQNAELKQVIARSISAELVTKESNRYTENIVETVREPLLVLNADMKIISANSSFYNTFKVNPGETIGSFIYDLGNKQWNIPKLRELLEEVLPEKQAFEDFEVSHLFEVIGHKIMLLNAREIYRQDVGAKMILLAIEDITERKQVESRLTAAIADLERSNKDLEQFAYSISHDLRAPLRAINGFSRMLSRDIKDKVDPEAMHKLATIRENGLKMNQLIDDVLAFSKLTQETMAVKVIDMEDLATDIWNELQENNPQQNISITVAHLMTCYGDRQMMRRVLTNLLSNAVKFTKERQAAMIEVGSYEEGHEYVYFVKDNGCGFYMQHSGKLFQLFQRLHSDLDYEGTGAGLSIVKRIIERHGGRVWAEGKVNEGATFYFTLPKIVTVANDSAQ